MLNMPHRLSSLIWVVYRGWMSAHCPFHSLPLPCLFFLSNLPKVAYTWNKFRSIYIVAKARAYLLCFLSWVRKDSFILIMFYVLARTCNLKYFSKHGLLSSHPASSSWSCFLLASVSSLLYCLLPFDSPFIKAFRENINRWNKPSLYGR